MDAMRVQTVIALGLAAFATTACGQFEKDHHMRPNGHGYHAQISLKLAELFPEDVFPAARNIARLCDEQNDIASCARGAALLIEGADVPIERADETAAEARFPVPEAHYVGIEANQEAALTIYRETCEGGYVGSCTALAELQLKGIGGTTADAATWFASACDKGIAGACAKIAELHQAGQSGLEDAALNARLEAACDAGNAEACALSADGSSRYGAALAPAAQDPTLIEIRKIGDAATVNVYTDNAAEAAALTARAREAFGDSVDVNVRAAQGVAPAGWLEQAPDFLVLAANQEGNTRASLNANSIRFNAYVADAERKAAITAALERLGGGKSVQLNLDEQVAEEPVETASVDGNVVGGESADAVVAE